ncbi:MAG: T9SS type A sorting domain-containing protein [Flavobacteriaceae bacterium]|nr:T9SS type A sorting domain-containing protein [Flavobacteriaceae bacterium]
MKYFTLLYLTVFLFASSLTNAQDIKRVRVNVKTTKDAVRPLLLSFTPNNAATDGFDYGYDGLCVDEMEDDLNYIIENKRCVIQGVGAFDDTKQYPFGMFIKHPGNIEISLDALENFESEVKVYIYDSLLNTYFKINDDTFSMFIDKGEYFNRFYITVQHPSDERSLDSRENALNNPQVDLNTSEVKYLSNSKELFVKTLPNAQLLEIDMLNILGKKVQHWDKSQMNNYNAQKFRLSNFATGSYIVIIKTSSGVLRKKIIVQR